MRIVCIGGGPAGLFFAIAMKSARPDAEIVVFERNRADDTFGWGVVFSDQTLGNIAAADPATYARIAASFVHWDDIDVHYRGRTIRAGGQGFAGIARKRLLRILQQRAAALGVKLRFAVEANDADYADADVIVVGDGANSPTRRKHAAAFGTTLENRRNRYVWLGTHQRFEAFTFAFEETPHGWFQVHAYQFDADTGTVIVECREETWRAAGLDTATPDESVAFCERLFGQYLGGHQLLNNAQHLASPWMTFVQVNNVRWHDGNRVLIGDAAHTAHFSIGSGTKLALEDAVALAAALCRWHPEPVEGQDRTGAFEEYEAERRIEVLRLQNAARNSTEWFENVARYASLEPEQFAYSLLTRSQRLTHDNLRLRDRRYVEDIEAWLSQRAGTPKPVPPMFAPFRLRELELVNRVVVSPMAMYSCIDGTPNDFYLVHLGARAQGGAGLVFTEMTCVSPEGRISPGCAGMYRDEHVAAWRRIVDFVHGYTRAKIALQLGHSGPKGSTQLGWEEADEPLLRDNWPVIAPSPIAYGERNQVPREMTLDDMERVKGDFVRAAAMGALRFRHARAALRARLPAREFHLAADQPAHRRLRRLAGKPAALSARGVRGDAGGVAGAQADVGAHLRYRLGRGRHHARRRGGGGARVRRRRAPTSSTSRPARRRGTRSRSTAACSRRRSPTRSATRRASRRWRSATSPPPIRSTPSSPRAAPISWRWRGRTSPTRTSRCTPRRSSATTTSPGPSSIFPAGSSTCARCGARRRSQPKRRAR